jgi:hypothetical protein
MTWPKLFDPTNAPPELLDLVGRLMPHLLAGDHPTLVTLRAQYQQARITKVELTGVGFFVDFEVPPDIAKSEPCDLTGGGANIAVAGVKHGAGCVLFVREGRLTMLEGFTYDDEWPEHPQILAIEDPVPILP